MPSISNGKERVVPLHSPGIFKPKLAIVKPVPREIRSRRKRWLELNPSYFESASIDLELTDPLAYDKLIRQHQTASEREAEGRKRGWASALETSLLRSEAKMAKIDPSNPKYTGKFHSARESSRAGQAQRQGPEIDWTIDDYDLHANGKDAEDAVSEEKLPENKIIEDATAKTDPKSQRLGKEQWHELLALRFIDGNDEDFDYGIVDFDEGLDEDSVGQKAQEDWFEAEEEHLDSVEGETGVQDY